ncbi:hypothetical protein IGK74_002394 [Enterococcus sp. AZ150]|uniref:phage gp6-like head-tail connector protein n=1 Tax=Enterococcus sp. AZ150 TaxID=2774866 RepID=UPI003F2274DE
MDEKIFIEEFKSRFRIFHSSEDLEIGIQLNDSFFDIQSLIGKFNPEDFPKGKELVYERTRYLRNESLEYFYDNFQTMIMNASIDLAGGSNVD